MMDVPFAFSSNGDGFVFHNKFITEGYAEITLSLVEFPSPETLWQMYREQNHISPVQDTVMDEPYYSDNPDKQPRIKTGLRLRAKQAVDLYQNFFVYSIQVHALD